MSKRMKWLSTFWVLLFALVSSPVLAGEPDMKECFELSREALTYSPYVDQDFPDLVLFGDTHLHTSYSADAGLLFNRLGPDAAYRLPLRPR